MTLAMRYDPATQAADLVRAGGSLLSDGGLETAVLISLFTDARATALEAPSEPDLRGWWADAVGETPINGSKLWLLERAPVTQETLLRARQYAADALRWLVDDGVASSVEVTASWAQRDRVTVLQLVVEITRADGRRWRHAWEVSLAV